MKDFDCGDLVSKRKYALFCIDFFNGKDSKFYLLLAPQEGETFRVFEEEVAPFLL